MRVESKATTFMDKLVSKKGHLIHKFRAKDMMGQSAYYFVLIEPHREVAFNKALKGGSNTLNFEDYGKIIASCYGDKPTEEVIKLLKDKYGLDV